ncbi:MAG TPA: hypothetical protein PKG95_13980 [Anaerolineaceae bacterium]|jgi:hypothetical protein|nr:hypothetical protein [Anaerolineaceae bacterium]
MINHVFSIICEHSSIDSETNTASILGVLEHLTVFTDESGDLNLPLQFEIFSHWARENVDQPDQGQVRVYFCAPSGQKKLTGSGSIDLSSVTFYRIRFRYNGIELSGPGLYKFFVEYQPTEDAEWVVVAQLPLLVTYAASK